MNCQYKRSALNFRKDNNTAGFSEDDQLGNSVHETKAGFYLKKALFFSNYCNSSSFYLRVRTEHTVWLVNISFKNATKRGNTGNFSLSISCQTAPVFPAFVKSIMTALLSSRILLHLRLVVPAAVVS